MDPGNASVSPGYRVLVVEDDDNIATALHYVVSREGMACDRVSNGGFALAHIRATRPDLVLLDVMLPEVSGYDICVAIRTDPAISGTRVLMMTARGSAQEQRRALEQGADGFIAKPFDLGKLRGEVWRLLSPPTG
ncbi:two-component system response regulator [Gemmobacter aquarius]|uniref:Two-component system response regulator n=1 Tax=Paragemmobacter aquarius TaxID=2169400 RepID=A0A2S0UPK0_9RHOB|nr:response regulator [Gemmobacter aquarius]AWB49721.1 two-component system response regulator [Gemmobacter aquarius]